MKKRLLAACLTCALAVSLLQAAAAEAVKVTMAERRRWKYGCHPLMMIQRTTGADL